MRRVQNFAGSRQMAIRRPFAKVRTKKGTQNCKQKLRVEGQREEQGFVSENQKRSIERMHRRIAKRPGN